MEMSLLRTLATLCKNKIMMWPKLHTFSGVNDIPYLQIASCYNGQTLYSYCLRNAIE